ncbi:glutaredoxin domain-containing protein [Paenibacillus glucanolyticus]|jgi:glutaredoxin|uniref:Glutaredoxin domain-containing protein n=1 Tax=Paenibacillus glucanolyticus TaxID=59843 RepID=A0A163G706_9BACL|nr:MULTISPECIES: glutaredoxin domain-containing protein [Paenibacillus]KZS44768.1 hypothetical protein AWU65_01900 [Paenibacillus glucanolyticus]MDH6675639.1 glutaredoxin [Paenibacillus sp. LBL]OMF64759.1 hypothetical protein BK142_31735 [Paenibacillus glucanolyticus]
MEMKVTVYTRQGCVYCMRIKEWMRNNQLQFEEVDVSSMTDLELKSQIKGVPYTVIQNGADKEVVLGFNEEKLTRIFLG